MNEFIFILTLIGLSLGIFCSVIVLINTIVIKYKDMANIMIFWLVLTDLLMASISIFLFFDINKLYCSIIIFFAMLFRSLNKFISLFISYALYQAIVRNRLISYLFLKYYVLLSIIFSIAQVAFGVLMLNPYSDENYCISGESTANELIYFITTEYAITFIILIVVIYLCLAIRNTIKQEVQNSNLLSSKRRFFAKRLIGYCIVFSFTFIPYVIIKGCEITDTIKNKELLRQIVNLFYAWYPFLDSAMYGLTKSFKRNIFNLCWKNTRFETEEEFLYIMRQENMLRPRFYQDLAGQSELGEISMF